MMGEPQKSMQNTQATSKNFNNPNQANSNISNQSF